MYTLLGGAHKEMQQILIAYISQVARSKGIFVGQFSLHICHHLGVAKHVGLGIRG